MSLFILDDMIIDESGGDSHENKRVKITTACDTCRRRKVKCDGESPCSNCQRGSYQCTFSDASAKRPRGPPKGFVALIEDRLHTIESLLVNLVNKDNVSETSALKDMKRERLDSNSVEDSSDVSQSHPGYANEMTGEDEEILQNNLIYPNVSNTLQCNALSFLKVEENDNVESGLSDYVEPSLPILTVELKQIPDEIYKQLFDKYFNHFHPCFPIINRGNFFRLLNNVDVENQPSKLLIEAICAVGAFYITKQNNEYNSQFFYERARSLLDNFADVPRLSTIQALILLCMLDQGKPSTYHSQTSCSIAIRMAQSIGLNRKNGAAYQGAKDRQTKKLVWWGCFVLDRLNSLNTGNPLIINDKVCDIELPSSDEMDDLDDDNATPSGSQNQNSQQSSTSTFSSTSHSSSYKQQKQQTNIFISYIRIMKLTGQILDHLQTTSCAGLQASTNHHAIIDIFESLLSDWSRELPPFLNYVSSAQNLPLPGQIATLHMHHQTLYLLLHYPYVAEYGKLRRGDRNVRTSKTISKSLNVCSAAANRITNMGVDALNNVNTCITFPSIFYCLGKAAKVHSINILSPQRGLAINSYKNIIKTVKICKFYKQNNIMKELAQKTISLLENILIKYQDKFSHEEIFGITPTGEIVNPDGLDLTLSSFGLNTNGIGNSSMTSPPQIKITPSNQIYSESFEGSNNGSKSIPSILLTSSSPTQKNINFIQNDNERNHHQQQQFNLAPDSLFVSQIMQANSLATTPTSDQFCWDMVDESFDNSSYDNMASPTSINVTTANQNSIVSHFSQPQRAQSLPTTSSQLDQYNPNTFNKSNTISSHSRSLSHNIIDSIDQVIHTSPTSSPTLQQSQRYVFMDINDNNEGRSNSFTSENNNGFVASEGSESSSVYDDDNSRMSFHNSTNYNMLFAKTPTTTPTSSRSRMTSPFSSSSSELMEKESPNNVFATGLYFGSPNELDNEAAINLLSKRVGNCSTINAETSLGIEYGGINDINNNNNYDVSDIGGGFRDFEIVEREICRNTT